MTYNDKIAIIPIIAPILFTLECFIIKILSDMLVPGTELVPDTHGFLS